MTDGRYTAATIVRRVRPFLAAVVTLALCALSLAATPGASGNDHATAARASASIRFETHPPDTDVAPNINWHSCDDHPVYDCAVVDVPLDYDHPDGKQIELGLLRDPADDANRRIGSLFVNPGGPGASAVNFATVAGHDLGSDVRKHFDIVGMDPRGVGRSSEVVCRSGSTENADRPLVAFPFGAREEHEWLRADARDRAVCTNYHNDVLDHATTADNARDIDRVREALGERAISYYGLSYGSYLGQTYAAMFPGRVRAMVLDGVLDPIAWSTGHGASGDRVGFSTRLKSGRGAYEALRSALMECDRVGEKRCSAAGGAYEKWKTIARKARNGSLVVKKQPIPYNAVVDYVLGGLYDQREYDILAQYIQYLYDQTTTGSGTRADQRASVQTARIADRLQTVMRRRQRSGPYAASSEKHRIPHVRTVSNPFATVACSDSINPRDPTAWVRASRRDDHISPWFGRPWTWNSSICATWPGSSADAYRGPWSTRTSSPILLVANTHDPATPLSGARVANRLFSGSRLLLLDGWGHGALGKSACVARHTEHYLIAQQLPHSGTVCTPNVPLYPSTKKAQRRGR